jgi:hypothetical protein
MIDEKLRNALNDPKVELFFIPSPYLRQLIAEGTHPVADGMVDQAKADLLSGHGIAMEAQMVIDFLEGKLDERFAFILRNSDIRILGAEEVLINLKKEQQRKPT